MESTIITGSMVQWRCAGFCYSEGGFLGMEKECELLASHGADGLACGCLKKDASLNREYNERLLEIIKKYGKEAVFHRAFDCSMDPYRTMEELIAMGVDWVLTSGLKPKAMERMELLSDLQAKYGDRIQILAGSGINETNAKALMEQTGISQVHSSCKDWKKNPTTVANGVSYSFAEAPKEMAYDVVSKELTERLIRSVKE